MKLNTQTMCKLLKRSRLRYFFFILGFISIVGCSDEESLNITEVEDPNLVLESFVFEKKNNPYLSEDIIFNIKDDTISGELKNYFFNAVPTFYSNAESVQINNVEQLSSRTAVDFRQAVTYRLKSGSETIKEYVVQISWDDALAHINFDTEGSTPIVSKEDYVAAVMTVNGQSKYSDLVIDANIRGRGNSTWTYPKKPYKIKLSHEESVLGLSPEKDWVLLANYIDGTHLLNAVGMKIGQLLAMPFTNNIVPVEVTINNEYLGLFMLTEQVEAKANRVDVGDDGILLNLDTNFDEDWQFRSTAYKLPVTVKYPKTMDADKLTSIKNQFETLEALVAAADFPNNQYLDYIDDVSIAKYLIVYMLTGNEEINHPKSTYIYKTGTGKFTMGPIWDFDWGFAYEGSREHFSSYDRPLFWSSSAKGTQFFSRLMSDPKIKSLMKEHWSVFKAYQLSELMNYIDEYAFITQGAKARDFAIWNDDKEVSALKLWIENRVSYMDNFMNGL